MVKPGDKAFMEVTVIHVLRGEEASPEQQVVAVQPNDKQGIHTNPRNLVTAEELSRRFAPPIVEVQEAPEIETQEIKPNTPSRRKR